MPRENKGGSLWRHRDFVLLWSGQTVDQFGTQVSWLAVPMIAIVTLHASRFEVAALSAAAWAMARRHPLETIAVVVLGLGGLIYPPVWLAGALLAISSRLWDIRDKITGLAVPAVLTIVGAAGLAMVTSHASAGAYVRDALMIGGYLLRAGAVLGAAYLTWRVRVGQRQPPPPPWRRDYH